MAVFRIFLSNAFYGFPGIAKEVTSRTFAKTVFPRDHLYTVGGMYGMSSLFSIRYLGRNGCQADYERLKITSKQKTISEISRSWDFDFRLRIIEFLQLNCELSPLFVVGIKLRSLASFTLNESKGEISLVVKCGCHCAYTNETSDNGNQM